jgi:CxxC motif-containing protein
LQTIAKEEHLKIIKRLLTTNVNVNATATNYKGRTTLQTIDKEEYLKIIKRLLTTNVNVNVATTNNYNS